MNGLNLAKLAKFIEKGEIENAQSATKELLEGGVAPHQIIEKGIMVGLDVVGEKFEKEEYFLPELIIAGEAAKKAIGILEPHLKEKIEGQGTVVIGTVFGDVHDLGKNIVASTLRGSGFKVIDLGVDVSAEEFVDSVRKEHADILAISALITTTMLNIKKVIDRLHAEGIRQEVKVMVGGAPLDETFAKQIGADAYGENARQAVLKARELVSKSFL